MNFFFMSKYLELNVWQEAFPIDDDLDIPYVSQNIQENQPIVSYAVKI